jgi:arginyl-tRNA synthetase
MATGGHGTLRLLMLRGDLEQELGLRVATAVHSAFGLAISPEEAVIRPAAPERQADYQSNAAMALARRLQMPSSAVAALIVERLDVGDMLEPPRVEGPGFVNLVLRPDWLQRHTTELASDERLGVPVALAPRRAVIDYSSANVAKEMHAGHLRSTVIGDSIARLLRFRGHEVIPQNHIGDWGTPFGMLLEHMLDEGRGVPVTRVSPGSGLKGGFLPQTSDRADRHAIADLDRFYQQARVKFDSDPAFAARARRRVVSLQSADPKTLELWREFVAESKRHFERVYDLMGVLLTPADYRGESFYNPMLADVATELESRGLAVPSQGALCVFPPGFTGRDGEPLPLIVRYSSGAYGYAMTDLAAIRYRARELRADDFLYVVGADQRLHLQMIFAVARMAGWLHEGSRVEHVSFGLILGPDHKRIRSRSGDSIKLIELLEEAVDRAAAIVAERSDLSDSERDLVARAVGIGAVKYADLSGDRDKDYVFDWDRMLAMEGNTAVYLQYANARVQSVIRKAGGAPAPGTPVMLPEPAERALALKLAQFPTAVEAAIAHLQPHRLCTYLYETAVAFSTFYEKCPILGAETETLRTSRLTLCALTSRVMVRGLDLLGIEAPERL